MDVDRVYTFPDEQINPDNAPRNRSLTERELGLQLTVFSAAQSLANLRKFITGRNTQEPSVQSSEAVPQVHVPQEPSDQSSEEHSLSDDAPLLILPLNSRPMETHLSGMLSVTPQSFSDRMILNRSFSKEPPIYMTSESLSYPPIFSSQLSVLSLSSKKEIKHLVKRLNTEGQSPELAKGEVVLRKEIPSLGEETLTLKSHEDVCVRSDEITLKQQRDLGVFTNDFSGQQPSSSIAHSQDESSSDHQEAAAPSFMDTLPSSLDSLTARQTMLESTMTKLTAKVDAMDSKLDHIISLLLTGHDAKKGEKQSNPDNPDEDTDDVPERSRGHKNKGTTTATSDAAKTLQQQSTHVAGTSQVSPAEAEDASTDLLIDSVEEAAKLYQALEIKGNIQKVHYKDPRLLLEDEIAARKLLELEFPGEDIEQILQEQKLYLSQSKSEKLKPGRKGKRRPSNVSRKGVIIPGNKRPNTRARSQLPSIPEKVKGKKILEGPSEIKQQPDQCATGILSEHVTTDPNLGYSFEDEEEEEEEIIMLTLRDKKKDADW